MIAFGIGMLVFPVTTDVYTARAQGRLRRELADRLLEPSASAVVPPGGSLGLIQIPKLALDDVIVEGTDTKALREAPGHYPGTPQPCTAGNAAVAGHRTTYGKPFSRLDELVPGDQITVATTTRRCTYEVVAAPTGRLLPHAGSAAWITGPNDWSAVGPLPGFDLTLTTCQPPGSATQRLIVRARLVAMG